MTVTKQQWRSRLLAARRARPEAARAAARADTSAHLLAWLTAEPARGAAAPVVCAYHPLPSEPLAADLPLLLARAGLRVLVPVAGPGVALDWCALGGPTRTGMLGVREPTGPRLGASAIGDADVVLVPALAVDRAGFRLGRGGGHYDRSLALVAPALVAPAPVAGAASDAARPRLVAVVFDEEVVDALPHEPHDVPVTDVLTPRGGLRRVARDRGDGASSN